MTEQAYRVPVAAGLQVIDRPWGKQAAEHELVVRGQPLGQRRTFQSSMS